MFDLANKPDRLGDIHRVRLKSINQTIYISNEDSCICRVSSLLSVSGSRGGILYFMNGLAT